MTNLDQTFAGLCRQYTDDEGLIADLWQEITTCYTGAGRHYHTLVHLANLLEQLAAVQADIADWPAVLWALYYHDAVYNPLKKDNEARSAALAAARIQSVGVPLSLTETVVQHILATQKHALSAHSDTNYLIDADLSILGQDWATYLTYTQQIRQEYAVYPNLLYQPGRRKVLEHFLGMAQIFKTPYFFEKYEAAARENLRRELAG
jgi:predicted metal-dependent HD superfamily phosphohydrolase